MKLSHIDGMIEGVLPEMQFTFIPLPANLLIVIQQTIIHIGVCAVHLHKSSVKFTNLFLGSPWFHSCQAITC